MALMDVKTYDPRQITITWGGTPIRGFAEGTFVSIEPNEQSWNRQTGADGQTSRARSADDTYTVTITLQQTSASNTMLSQSARADRRGGDGLEELQVKDQRGETLFLAPQAWIQQMPTQEFAQEIEGREWVIETGPVEEITAGGNPING